MTQTAVLERTTIVRRGQRLEYFTIVWNLLEGLAAVVAGVMEGSISLVSFGIDSFIEVTSGTVLLWRLAVDSDVHRREQNEKRALKIVGACFLALARTSLTNPLLTSGSSVLRTTASPASFWPAFLWW